MIVGNGLSAEIFVVEYLGPTAWTNAYEGTSLKDATDTIDWYRDNGFTAKITSHVVDQYGQIVEGV